MSDGSAAWHEAGHALAAHLFGGRVREVTLESEREGHAGHVAVEWRAAEAREDARRSALVALAGPVAELVHLGESLDQNPTALEAWRDDWNVAEGELERLQADPAGRERLRRAMLAELHARFQDPVLYERLARLADALEAHGTLDEDLFLAALG